MDHLFSLIVTPYFSFISYYFLSCFKSSVNGCSAKVGSTAIAFVSCGTGDFFTDESRFSTIIRDVCFMYVTDGCRFCRFVRENMSILYPCRVLLSRTNRGFPPLSVTFASCMSRADVAFAVSSVKICPFFTRVACFFHGRIAVFHHRP